jgi:hypothetical protein
MFKILLLLAFLPSFSFANSESDFVAIGTIFSSGNDDISVENGISCKLVPRVDGVLTLEIVNRESDGCEYGLSIGRGIHTAKMKSRLKQDLPKGLECGSSSRVETSGQCGVQIGARFAKMTAKLSCEAKADASTRCELLKVCRSRMVNELKIGNPETTVNVYASGKVTPRSVSKIEAMKLFDEHMAAGGCVNQ